ncbi:hypothetical protein M2368_000241 [Arthrobacter sp. JUb119]|nr:hypothetical protein [Arthrobacter sp. JUb119]
MSLFHVHQIESHLRGLYEQDHWDPKLTDVNNLSRLLAFHALKMNIGEGADGSQKLEIVDGGGDRGIDAVGIDPVSNVVVLVQAKWRADGTGSMGLDGMLKFLDGARSLLGMRVTGEPATASQETRESLQTVLRTPGAKIRLVTVTTAAHALDNAVLQPLNVMLEQLNDLQEVEPLAIHVHLGQAELFRSISVRADEEVSVDLQILDWGRLTEPQRVYYGRVSAAEVANWYVQHGADLFAENIRVVIPRSEINDGIKETIQDSPEDFFYFNNGLTMLADSISIGPIGGLSREVGYFKLKNASIVNGAQTVSTLGKLASGPYMENLGRAFVMIRCIEVPAEEETLGASITRFANTQNQVSSQDFAFLDPEQGRLVQELHVLGFEYLLRAAEVPKSANPKDIIRVRDAAIALACASSDLSHAVTAKREVSRLFTDTYSALFNPSTDPLRLSRAVQIVAAVDDALDDYVDASDGITAGIAVHGRRVIAHLIMQNLGRAFLSNPVSELVPVLDAVPSQATKLVADFEDHFPENTYPGNLFKNVSRVRALLRRL